MPAPDHRTHKRHRLLGLVRRGVADSRLELGRHVPWSKSSVCALVQQMVDDGWLLEELEGDERRGRNPVPLRLNPALGQYLGFDLEARRMRLVLVDYAGEITWRCQEPLGEIAGREALIARVLGFIERGIAEAGTRDTPLLGIGLAAPGIIDHSQGVVRHYDLIPGASNLPLRDLVAAHTGLPCVMDHNIRAYTLAEWLHGAGRHLTDFVCVGVRSGLGAGLVVGGQLLRGSHGFAGEVGYSAVPGQTPMSQWRTLQQLVSESALGSDAEAGSPPLTEARARRAGELLGAALATLASTLDPQAIVLAGSLVQPDGALHRFIEPAFRRHVLPDIVDRVVLAPSQLGPFAAALGITHVSFNHGHPAD